MGKIHGITVVLYEKTDSGESDAFGHPIYTEIPVKVENILVGQPTAQEILDADLYFIREIGLTEHLSPTRSNGLLAMVKQIKMYALAMQAKG